MNILSIDLGKFNSMACFYNSDSGDDRHQAVKTEREYLRTLLSKRRIDLDVLEACSCSGWASDLCNDLRLKPLVCSSREEAWVKKLGLNEPPETFESGRAGIKWCEATFPR